MNVVFFSLSHCYIIPHASYCAKFFELRKIMSLNSVVFVIYLVSHLPYFCVSLVMLLFNMVLNHTAEVLSGNPKCKKAVRCFTEKVGALEKLHPGMHYSVVGCELNVNKPTIHIHSGVFNHQSTLNTFMH